MYIIRLFRWNLVNDQKIEFFYIKNHINILFHFSKRIKIIFITFDLINLLVNGDYET